MCVCIRCKRSKNENWHRNRSSLESMEVVGPALMNGLDVSRETIACVRYGKSSKLVISNGFSSSFVLSF